MIPKENKKTYLDSKLFESLAQRVGLPKKLRKEIFNMLESEVLEIKLSIEIGYKAWLQKNYLSLDAREISKEYENRNMFLKEESVKKAWDDYIMIHSDLVDNIISDIRNIYDPYDCISYFGVSKKEKEKTIENILKKHWLTKECFSWEVFSWIKYWGIWETDLEKESECINETIDIAKRGILYLNNKFKTIELVSSNKDILHYGIQLHQYITSKDSHYIDDRINWIIEHLSDIISYEHNEDIIQLVWKYFLNKIISIDLDKDKNTTKKYIQKNIAIFPTQERFSNILNIAYLIYIQSNNPQDIEYLFSELHYRVKKITKFSEEKVLVWLTKAYIDKLFAIKIIETKDRKNRLEKNRNELLDILPKETIEEYFQDYIMWQEKTIINIDEKEKRKKYKIWLVFWDPTSVVAFKLYTNHEKDLFIEVWISPNQLNILCKSYDEQKKLDILSSIRSKKVDFILAFETDHETKFRNLAKKFSNIVSICSFPWENQHFSKDKFEILMRTAIKRYENNYKIREDLI